MKRDKNKELMLAAGSKTGAYDIEAPDQWRWVMTHAQNPLERAMAWVKSKTTAFRHESPFCVDDTGRPVYVRHLAADMGWKEQTARNVLVELQAQGRAQVKGKRIWYCADVPQANQEPTELLEQPEGEEPELIDRRTRGEQINSVQRYFGVYVADFISEQSEKKQIQSLTALENWRRRKREIFADVMAAARMQTDPIEDTILEKIGIPKKRLPKRRPAEVKWVQLSLLPESNPVQSMDLPRTDSAGDFVDARAVLTQQQQQQKSPQPSTVPVPSNGSLNGVSSSSKPIESKKKSVFPSKGDDEKPKPEYASPRDEVKAIYHAKTGTYPTVQLLDRIESIVAGKGHSWDNYLEILKPHLGGNWKIPGAFLTHLAQTGFQPPASPPREKPKPKCPRCSSDNHRGAIMLDGAIVPCPDCSTSVGWRDELAAKMNRPPMSNGRGAATA